MEIWDGCTNEIDDMKILIECKQNKVKIEPKSI
jgi:hypothetical protein